MAFKKVQSLDVDVVYKIGPGEDRSGKANPTSLEGYYLGNRQIKTDTGFSTIHVLQTPKGNVGFWGSADTNAKLGQVTPGIMVLVEYVTKKKLTGGKSKLIYDVSFDDTNTIEVATLNAGSSESDVDEESDDSGAEFEAAEEEYQAPAARPAPAARAQQVQALLNRKAK